MQHLEDQLRNSAENKFDRHVASDTASNTDDDDAHDDKDDKDDDDGDDNSSDDDDDDDKGDDGDDDIFDLCGEQTGSLVIHAPAGRAE